LERKIVRAQNVSRMCMVCGRENPLSLHAHFYELADGELAGVFTPLPEHQSYPGRLHGGVTSAVLDETIGRAINMLHPDAWGVTIELTVKLRKPVPTTGELLAVGRITRDTGRLFEGSGEVLLADGTVAAEATGRYLKLPIERIAEGDFHREWFADTRPLPATIDIAGE
jgi:acyl-coenzyme A thioesterase PaaI-like protein